jgi:hypothetical protein
MKCGRRAQWRMAIEKHLEVRLLCSAVHARLEAFLVLEVGSKFK